MDKEIFTDLGDLYSIICSIIYKSLMQQAKIFGVDKEQARTSALGILQQIIERVDRESEDYSDYFFSRRLLKKWTMFKDTKTLSKRVVAEKYQVSVQYVYKIVKECTLEKEDYEKNAPDRIPWYIRLAEV